MAECDLKTRSHPGHGQPPPPPPPPPPLPPPLSVLDVEVNEADEAERVGGSPPWLCHTRGSSGTSHERQRGSGWLEHVHSSRLVSSAVAPGGSSRHLEHASHCTHTASAAAASSSSLLSSHQSRPASTAGATAGALPRQSGWRPKKRATSGRARKRRPCGLRYTETTR
jgi:hypothetical protein